MGLFDTLWPNSPAVAATVLAICCEGGWDVKSTIGSQAARGLRSRAEDRSGGRLPVAMQESNSGDVGIQFAVAFDLEPGRDPGSRSKAQGTVRLLSTSRYLSTEPEELGSWKVTSADDDEVPTAIQWRLQCTEITVGGDTFVPKGPVYFNAFTTAERVARGLDAGSGRVTIREDSSFLSGIFGTRSIIEEFKTVGKFEISPRESAVRRLRGGDLCSRRVVWPRRSFSLATWQQPAQTPCCARDRLPLSHTLSRRAAIVGACGGCVSSTMPCAAAPEADWRSADAENLEARLSQLLEVGGPMGARLSPSQVVAADAVVGTLEGIGGTQLGAASDEGVWELPFVGGWDVLLARPTFVGGPPGGDRAGGLELVSARQFIWGPGEEGTSTECVYAEVRSRPDVSEAVAAIVLTRTGSITNLPATDVRFDFPTPPSASSTVLSADAGKAPTLGTPKPLGAVGLSIKPGGTSLRRTTYLSERLWVMRSSDDGGLMVLRRTDTDALQPPSRRLYGKVYSLRYSD